MKEKRLRVLQLGKFYPIKGGVEKVMYDLTTGFAERFSHKVICDMMCADGEKGSRTIHLGGNARLICCRTLWKVAATMISPSMIHTLKKECRNYDIIHVHHPDPMACIALFLSGYKGKVVLHWHSDIQKQKVLLKFYQPLQEWLLKRADLILGTSPVYLAESPCLQSVQGKTRCLPIGVEPMRPQAERVAAIREKYPCKKIVFSLGRLVAYKGYEYLIEAARFLDDDYVLLIGGTGPLKAELDEKIKMLGLEGKVVLLGRVSDGDLPAYYGACELFCLSSVQKTEAFGIVQIEAMSCGKPIVATTIPQSGVAWVNAHGVSGLNVVPEKAKELALAIQAILNDQVTYNGYSQRAAQRYHDIFTRDKMIESCVDIYERICDGKKY